MKKILLSLFISSTFLFTNILFPGNEFSHDPNRNFMNEKLSREFDLEQICKEHSKQALIAYQAAIAKSADVKDIVPDEVFEKIKYYKTYSFIPLNPRDLQVSLYEICAHKVANVNLIGLKQEEIALVHTLRSILFYARFNKSYNHELAQLLIRVHLDRKYRPSKKLLNSCLCVASYLGDALAVQTLLAKGATGNFINKDDLQYTPLAYAVIKEHTYSKINNKTFEIQLIIRNYELIAEMLIKAGADATRPIGSNTTWGNDRFVFKHTSNVKIFSLFEEQVEDIVKRHVEAASISNPGAVADLGLDLVKNAFSIGDAKFIKKIYANPLYRKCVSESNKSFMDLAEDYYKGSDFEELYKFLVENGERRSGNPQNLNFFRTKCLFNALDSLDYECLKSFNNYGVKLNSVVHLSDNSNLLTDIIKRAQTSTNKNNLIKTIELFMKIGVCFYNRDKTGKIALDYAIEPLGGKKRLDNDIIEALIMTPLIFAIKTSPYNKQQGLVELIYLANNDCNGAVESYRDSKGKTALDYAKERNLDSSIIEALQALITPNFI